MVPNPTTMLSRREMLTRCGVGMGMLGLIPTHGRVGVADRAREGRGEPARTQEAALPGEGEARHPHLRQRRAESGRYVRPKPALDEVRGQDAADRQPQHRTQDRCGVPVAVQVREARPVRAGGERTLREHREAHRRYLRHPLDVRGRAEPRAVVPADEHRRAAADPPERWQLGHLRSRHREPEPARLRDDVPRRVSATGVAELAGGFPAGRVPGHVRRYASTQTSRSSSSS